MMNLQNVSIDQPLKVIIGAGGQTWPGWIPTQKEELNLLDRQTWVDALGERRVDGLLCEHVWEHLTSEEATIAASICYEFLKPGGRLRCAVPDGNYPDEAYQRLVHGDVPTDHPAADHKVAYTYQTFMSVFRDAGFDVDLLEYCDESGRFHYNHWTPEHGTIYRSLRFDHRNQDGNLGFVSLIIDAIKPES